MVSSLSLNGVYSPSQYLNQSFANSAFPDFSDGTGIGLGMNPIGQFADASGNYTSVFGGMNPGLCGMGMGMGTYGMGAGMMAEMNMSTADRQKYYDQMQVYQMGSQERLSNLQLEQQVRQKHKYEAAEMSAEAPEKVLLRRSGSLQDLIVANEQDQVMGEYSKITEQIREQYKEGGYTNVPEEKIRADAEDAYFKATGNSIKNALRANGDSEFWQGCKEGFCGLGLLGLTNKKNYKDNIADINGTKVSGADQAWRWTGRILAAALTAPVAILAAKGGWKGLKAGWKGLGKLIKL